MSDSLAILGRHPYFAGLPPEILAAIRSRVITKRHKKGAVIYAEGDVFADVVGNWFDGVDTPLSGPGLVRDADPNSVPAPGSLLLLVTGLALFGRWRRTRRALIPV